MKKQDIFLIAQLLGWPISAVKLHKKQGFQMLRATLKPELVLVRWADQAELFGIFLKKIHNLNLELLSVNPEAIGIDDDQ